jgi:hypothetical protein
MEKRREENRKEEKINRRKQICELKCFQTLCQYVHTQTTTALQISWLLLGHPYSLPSTGSIGWPSCSMGMNPGIPPVFPRATFSPGSALGQIGSVLAGAQESGNSGVPHDCTQVLKVVLYTSYQWMSLSQGMLYGSYAFPIRTAHILNGWGSEREILPGQSIAAATISLPSHLPTDSDNLGVSNNTAFHSTRRAELGVPEGRFV